MKLRLPLTSQRNKRTSVTVRVLIGMYVCMYVCMYVYLPRYSPWVLGLVCVTCLAEWISIYAVSVWLHRSQTLLISFRRSRRRSFS
jgi:hypothetical protein